MTYANLCGKICILLKITATCLQSWSAQELRITHSTKHSASCGQNKVQANVLKTIVKSLQLRVLWTRHKKGHNKEKRRK